MKRVPVDRVLSNRVFYVTMTLEGRRQLFAEATAARVAVDTLAFYGQRGQAVLLGYVVMPDHVHALVCPNSPLTISRWVRQVKTFSVRAIAGAPIWQEGYWSEIVQHDWFLKQKLEYIHANPLRAGLVTTPVAYVWSSAAEYQQHEFRIVTPYWKIALCGRPSGGMEPA